MEILKMTQYNENAVLPLYESVGWTNYTGRPAMLRAAYEHSLCILGAYENNKLLGILRAVGDGASIMYIQDIIVHPDFQRHGIGTALITDIMARYPNVYQTVLMTDDTESSRAFYMKNGFLPATSAGCAAFIKIRS